MYNLQAKNSRNKLIILFIMAFTLFSILISKPALAATTVTADFSVNNGTGHPDIFGGTENVLNDTAKIDALQQSGMSHVRRGAHLWLIAPDTTVSTYLAGIGVPGSVADPNTWDWSDIAWIDDYYNRGIKIMLIMAEMPPWLGYQYAPPHTSSKSPPTNWVVYEDIVKKIYQRYQGKIASVEIWNEPNCGMSLAGSPYPYSGGCIEDEYIAPYLDLYYHAAKAIRSVDASIPIGGPAVSRPDNYHWASHMFANANIASVPNSINFLSYHDYQLYSNESVFHWQGVAAGYGRNDFPVYVTEWNYSASYAL
ncbi:MAG TPA: hypothetical protein VGE40_08700, partial [Bacilli bacterium]